MSRTAILVVLAGLALGNSSFAAVDGDHATGPAAMAVRSWFATDKSLGCYTQDGRNAACGRANDPTFQIFYGDADGGPGQPDALAFVAYTGDPTGNSENFSVAQFRELPNGGYRLVRRIPSVPGSGVAPGTKVVFGQGRATWTALVPRPGDSRQMPTGQRQVTIPLR